MNSPATLAPQTASDFSAAFLGRLVEASRVNPAPTRFGRFAYVGTAEGAWNALRDRDAFDKSYDLLERLGRSRFSTNDADWTARRAMTQPLYAAAGRAKNAGLVGAVFAERIDAAEPNAAGVAKALMDASAAVFLQAVGARDISPRPGLGGLFSTLRDLARNLQIAGLFGAPNASLHAMDKRAAQLRAAVGELCAEDAGLSDLCVRMNARPDRPDGFDAPAEILFNFFAAIDTTLSTLTFALDRLGTLPKVQMDLAREASGGDTAGLSVFVDETLRFFPPIPFLTRKARRDGRYDATEVKEGENVLISILAVQRDPACWSQAQSFEAARPEFANGTYDRRAFMPFSAGERICGGLAMARLELVEGLAAVLRRFEIERPEGPVRVDYALNMRPVWPEAMVFRPRASEMSRLV